LGSYWFRQELKTGIACRGCLVGLVKISRQKLNAEDNTDAILAEAEYIFNNADLFAFEEEYDLAV